MPMRWAGGRTLPFGDTDRLQLTKTPPKANSSSTASGVARSGRAGAFADPRSSAVHEGIGTAATHTGWVTAAGPSAAGAGSWVSRTSEVDRVGIAQAASAGTRRT